MAETSVELLDNAGLGRSEEQIAGILILKALRRAIESLVKDNWALISEQTRDRQSYKELDIESFQKALVKELPDDAWEMNGDFFQHPKNLPMLKPIQQNLATWLEQYIAAVDTKSIGDRAYRYIHLDADQLGQRLNLAAIQL